jgi:UDP-N-acetylmuramoyl-tripeptide--D-alanyl-D-alanine ligase
VRPRPLSSVARAVDGTSTDAEVEVRSVVTDSREAGPGAMFVALRGERLDGHRFVHEAFGNGAAAVLVDEDVEEAGPLVRVADTATAFLALAADERRGFDATVAGVTGANGKTSTKDMAGSIVSRRFRTYASPASFNNEVGVPATILGTPPDTDVLIVELGARRVGDVTMLCEIARPSIVVVTNVGVAHMEVFGSWERIVEAAAEPVLALDDGGVAVLNADDPVVAGFASLHGGRTVTFGRAESAEIRADAVTLDRDGCASFELACGDDRAHVHLVVPGEHMVLNALAAAAVGCTLGVSVADCAAGLAGATVSRWRMETFTTDDGVRVLNDAYNANPESMAAALRTARWMASDGRMIAVLGAMAELGDIAETEHERIGELAARLRIHRLVTIGDQAKAVAVAGLREGIEPDAVASYDDLDAALADVRAHARSGDLVLVKASRVVGLERLAEALR